MSDNLKILLNTLSTYEIREETLNGKSYLVVPAAMLVEGVHVANHGAVLHRPEEFGKIPQSWNGIPITVQHPQDDAGNFISANAPEILQGQTIGTVFGAHLDANNTLMSEAWIDEEKTAQLYPSILEHLRNQQPLELSTGLFSDNVPAESGAEWQGQSYTSIAHNYRPDHLALLPGGEGACNWAAGCGIRANQKGGEVKEKELIQAMKAEVRSLIAANKASFQEILNTIQTKLDNMDTDTRIHFLEPDGTFENDFVFRVRTHGGVGSSTTERFRRTYTLNEDGTIEFTGEPIPVVRNVEFVEANSKKKGVTAMAKKEKCCAGQVNAIIQSNQTRFEEGDREYLEGLEKDRVIQLLPVEVDPIDPLITPTVNKEQAIEVLKGLIKTPDEFLALCPPAVSAYMKHGMEMATAERQGFIEHIVANCNKVYDAEALKPMTTGALKRLVQALPAPSDFTGLGGGSPVPAADESDMLFPPGVE